MENISAVSIDMSKAVFQFHGVNHAGRGIFARRMKRESVLDSVHRYIPKGARIFMEAGSGAHYWSRELRLRGYDPRQIAPQHVTPYVKRNKNDEKDAEAICEAGLRPHTEFVPEKNSSQLEVQAMHRIRARLIKNRTALMNETRGFLAEHGVVVRRGMSQLRMYITNDIDNDIKVSLTMKRLVKGQLEEILWLNDRIKKIELELSTRARQCAAVTRLMEIPGIGVITATALTAVSGNPKIFKNGRQFSAWLGLTPRITGTAGKNKILGLSKRGNVYLRTLLILGAHGVLRFAKLNKHTNPHSLWIRSLKERKGENLAAVALANKNARIAWKLLTSSEHFNPELPH